MAENPYQAPQTDVLVTQQGTDDYIIASTGQRFANLILDTVFFYLFAFLAGILFQLLDLSEVLLSMNQFVLGILLGLVYFIPQEGFWGRTLGKLITGTRVVNVDGTCVSFGRAVGRTLCRWIPFEAFSFLFGDGQPVGWHDRIPNTRVIRTRKYVIKEIS